MGHESISGEGKEAGGVSRCRGLIHHPCGKNPVPLASAFQHRVTTTTVSSGKGDRFIYPQVAGLVTRCHFPRRSPPQGPNHAANKPPCANLHPNAQNPLRLAAEGAGPATGSEDAGLVICAAGAGYVSAVDPGSLCLCAGAGGRVPAERRGLSGCDQRAAG